MRRMRVALSLMAVGLAALWPLPTAFAQPEPSFETWCAEHDESCVMLRTALETAETIPATNWLKVIVLTEIADGFARNGLLEEARRVFGKAVTLAPAISSDIQRPFAVDRIARGQAEAGLWDDAFRTARRLLVNAPNDGEGLSDMVFTIARIANAQTNAGLADDAAATLAQARHLLAKLVDYTRSNPGEDQRLSGQRARDHQIQIRSAIDAVSQAELHAGLWEQARITASLGSDPETQIRPLARRAVIMAEAGLIEGARESAREALGVARSIPKGRARDEPLVEVVDAQARIGLFDEALGTAQEITSTTSQARAIGRVARQQAAAGLSDQARSTLAQLTTRITDLGRSPIRRHLIRIVAIDQASVGFAADALATASLEPDLDQRTPILSSIARTHAQNGAWEAALTTSEAIPSPGQRVASLAVIARAQIAAGLVEDGLTSVQSGRAAAAEAQAQGERVWGRSLAELAGAQAEAGLWQDAFSMARSIQDSWERAEALHLISIAQSSEGLWEAARITADGISDDGWRSEALAALARAQLSEALALAQARE